MTMPNFEPVAWWIKDAEQFHIGKQPFAKAWKQLYTTDQLQQAYSAGLAEGKASAVPVVKIAKMEESSGNVWWSVFLAKSKDDALWDCHEVYSDAIEGRARYEAASLEYFFGIGPKPDILSFDTDVASPEPTK